MRKKLELKNKQLIADRTMAFVFKRPSGFEFTPGQYIELFVEVDGKVKSRYFSIASDGETENIVIATRLTGSDFKETIKNFPVENTLEINGPMGEFTLHQDNAPVVFLVGGIGITPIRSMVLNEEEKGFSKKITLFYSNRQLKDAAFYDELKNIKSKRFTFVPTMTQQEDWQGETGYIDEEMLKKYIHDLNEPIYYIVGPPGFVKAMNELLAKLSISKKQIRYEEFIGYR